MLVFHSFHESGIQNWLVVSCEITVKILARAESFEGLTWVGGSAPRFHITALWYSYSPVWVTQKSKTEGSFWGKFIYNSHIIHPLKVYNSVLFFCSLVTKLWDISYNWNLVSSYNMPFLSCWLSRFFSF